MNVTSIRLYSVMDTHATASVLQAEFFVATPSTAHSLILKSATGLDPEDILSKFYGYGVNTADKYFNLTMPPRTVSFLIGLNPQYASSENPQTLRDKLYQMIGYTRQAVVEIRLMSGATPVASLFGQITKFESQLFGGSPDVQITFFCKDPIFKAPAYISPVTPAKPSPSWTDSGASSMPIGFQFQITFTAAITSPFLIQGVYGQTYAPFSINKAFASGDVLYFSSELGNRYLYVVSGGVTTQLGDKIVSTSVWPMMFPGQTTQITFPTSSFNYNVLQYKPCYWGI